MNNANSFSLGIVGLGTVGLATIKLLENQLDNINKKSGKNIIIKAISAKDKNKSRSIDINKYDWEESPLKLTEREDIDAIVELIGGSDGLAKELAYSSIKNKKLFITANKALIAKYGYDLHERISKIGSAIYYEAAVAGAIPVINSIKDGLVSDNIISIHAILNGTCNYILSDMTNNSKSFADALIKAKELGFAEADPTFDIEGIDSAHKLVILGLLAYGAKPNLDNVYIEGITSIKSEDIKYADRLGYKIKLICIASIDNNKLDFRVHPALCLSKSISAGIGGALNAVFLEGDYSKKLTFIGEGAGAEPTASSVVSDIINAAKSNKFFNNFHSIKNELKYKNIMSRVGKYYLRLLVSDKIGVLASITSILDENDISLDSVIQEGNEIQEEKYIIILTHDCNELNIINAINKIENLDTIIIKPHLIRVEKI
ncbi:MAG: homoserine dehydrogenase [Pelagibacterales bacterium]|nr:homoserine dehydrogenase [Pelagibacterales bacterium]PPR15785.1 MAG: Homoserine dehydrogenase [Alphaproteobacteria bacterium MarineAlpha9_Bin3]|tara:strand:- start:8182 stop:9474 length:1293 start_codon:yes stop_codon:yes gene_type:complete